MGWTLDYVQQNVDLPTLEKLTRYWRKFPPVHVLVARYVGYKADDANVVTTPQGAQQTSDGPSEIDMQTFMDMVPTRAFAKPVARTHGD